MPIRDPQRVLRRVQVLTTYVLRGFDAENGGARDVGAARARLRRLDLLDELEPEEHAFLLGAGDVTQRQVTDATWRSEALVALRWAIHDAQRLPVGGQVSLLQAVPDLDGLAAGSLRLRPERELRRALELWFAVYWRMRLRQLGVERFDLARWVTENPYLTELTAADLPLIGRDLSLDAAVMEVARDDPASAGGWRLVMPDAPEDVPDDVPADWPVEDGRVPIRVCTEGMLGAGENVLRVAAERLRALRWLCGGADRLGQDPPGHYEPDSDVAHDKAVLYRDERSSVRGGLPWCRAAWLGDTAQLRAMADAGLPTFMADVDGDLALHCAVLAGQRPALELLLAEDGSIAHTLRDEAGRTVLELAAERGDTGLVDAIAATLAPDDAWLLRDSGALVAAVRAGQAAAVARLIELGVALDGALDAAVAADRPDMVRLLVERGVAVEPEALYQALGARRLATAAALADLGADPGYADDTGTTVLHLAADRGATDVCLRLLDRGADVDTRLGDLGAVHFAILGGHTATALALVERGADLAGPGEPLVALAVRGGSAELVRWCVDRGETPAPDAVQAAVLADRPDVLTVLVDAGRPVGVANASGITPLHLAADRGYAGCVEVLLRAGAPVDPVVPGQGRTALDLARLQGHDDCVRLLT